MEKAFSEEIIKNRVHQLLEANPHQKWLQEGFTIVANKSIVNKNLTSSDFKVYVILLMHMMNKESCFPSHKKIAEEAGLKTTRQVINILNRLEKSGYLQIKRRGGRSNIYTPLMR